MNQPKLAGTSVDTERVIRDLLDAFKSLKTATTPSTFIRPTEGEQRQSLSELHDDPLKEVVLAGGAPSEVSPDSRPDPDASLADSSKVPAHEVGEPEQTSALESAGDAETPQEPIEVQSEAQSGQYGMIEAFCKDHRTIERLQVTREELQALADTSLLGTLTCKQDVLFILRQTRAARNASQPRESVQPEPMRESSKDIELSDFRWWAEHIRRESMARLDESDSWNDLDHRNPLSRPFVLSVAVVLVTTAIAIGIEMC
jgi:hypothetical protein